MSCSMSQCFVDRIVIEEKRAFGMPQVVITIYGDDGLKMEILAMGLHEMPAIEVRTPETREEAA